jgi:cytochrome c oxidase cbb3-type subunit 4
MDTYSVFREIADSWGLIGMMIFFCAAVLMLFRPSAKKMHQDASLIPFRDDQEIISEKADTSEPKLEQSSEASS